jgi:hypothetical protein
LADADADAAGDMGEEVIGVKVTGTGKGRGVVMEFSRSRADPVSN